jgi:hypothetical protein
MAATAGPALSAQTPVHKMTGDKENCTRNDRDRFEYSIEESVARNDQEQRRSKHHKNTALLMNAHAPANAGGRQRERNREEKPFETFVCQEADTKKRKDRRGQRRDCAMYGTREGHGCPDLIDTIEFGWIVIHWTKA